MNTLFATYSGKIIDFNNIKEADICLEDIAHHLTNITRFGGALPLGLRLSVASHSLNCYQMAKWLCPYDLALHRAILMHDATEAYLGDVVSGLKHCLLGYRNMEWELNELLIDKYGLFTDSIQAEILDEIDKSMMLTEVSALIPTKLHLYDRTWCDIKSRENNNWGIKPDKYPGLIKQLFLDTCKELDIHD